MRQRRLVAAERHAETAFAALGVSPDQLPDLVRDRTDAAARVRALLPRATRMDELAADAHPRSRPSGPMSQPQLDRRWQARQRRGPGRRSPGSGPSCDDAAAARAAREGAVLRLAAVDERVRAQQEALEVAASLESGRVAWQVARAAATRPARALADDP